jgi:hypothetical protein
MRGNPLRERKRKESRGTRFLKEGAPRTAIMHQWALQCVEGSQSQDACRLHAQWTRTPPAIPRGRGTKWLKSVSQIYHFQWFASRKAHNKFLNH